MLRNLLRFRFSDIYSKSVRLRQVHLVKDKLPLFNKANRCSISKYISFALVSFISVSQTGSYHSVKCGGKDKVSVNEQIKQSDELFSVGKFEESLKALDLSQDSDNVEILWRKARALFNLSKSKKISKSESASLVREAFDCIEKALNLNKDHYAIHKWMAILSDAKSALDGMKARIKTLPVFKEHLLTAIELNPKDATSIYMLGQYMYNIADMSWLQRTIAKSLFGTPPEATFEEAFYYFSKAEEVEPNFYSANLLMLGKTCLKLKRIGAGRYWLKCALSYPVRTDEDEAVRLEAEELLKKHPAVEKDDKS